LSDENDRGATPEVDSTLLLRVVETLKGVPSHDRDRYVRAAMVFLGTPIDSHKPERTSSTGVGTLAVPDVSHSPSGYPRRVNVWMNQNSLDEGALDNVFHVSPSGVEVIAHTLPGKSNRERVRGCYLLAGVKSFLSTGEPRFADEVARAICRDLGCYDPANHSTFVRSLGNLVAGSKSSSFELTQPGLKAAAELIRAVGTNV